MKKTKLGIALSRLNPCRVDNPVLSSLIRALHYSSSDEGFNDTRTPHRDVIDHDHGNAHTDQGGEYVSCAEQKAWEAEHHSDVTNRSTGVRNSHTDDTTESDAHTDSRYEDYSDMTR